MQLAMGAFPETDRKDGMISTFGVLLREGADDTNLRTGTLVCFDSGVIVVKLVEFKEELTAFKQKSPLQMCFTTGKTNKDRILSILCDDNNLEVLGLGGTGRLDGLHESSSIWWKVSSIREAHFCLLIIQLEARDESTAITLPYHRIM